MGKKKRRLFSPKFANWRKKSGLVQVEEPKVEEPKVEEPVIEKPKVEESTAEEPKVEQPVVEVTIAEEPEVKTPAKEKKPTTRHRRRTSKTKQEA